MNKLIAVLVAAAFAGSAFAQAPATQSGKGGEAKSEVKAEQKAEKKSARKAERKAKKADAKKTKADKVDGKNTEPTKATPSKDGAKK